MDKDNKEPVRKNRKTVFERTNKKSRSNKDHLDQENGGRYPGTKPADPGP